LRTTSSYNHLSPKYQLADIAFNTLHVASIVSDTIFDAPYRNSYFQQTTLIEYNLQIRLSFSCKS